MIRVGNVRASKAVLRLPWWGCWELAATLQGPAPEGVVVVDWSGWRLVGGTVDPERSGTFAGEGRVVVVGGLQWSTMLEPRFYTDDRGLFASTVAEDVATAAGASIIVEASAERDLGRYWPRRRETAGSVLSRLFGQSWRVDPNGETRAGARPAAQLGAAVSVLGYDPMDGVVELFAPRPDAAPSAAVVTSSRLPGPRRLVEVVARAEGAVERLYAFTEAA